MVFEFKRLNYKEVLDLLVASEDDYCPPLSCQIDVRACAQKWSEKAWFVLGIEGGNVASVMAFYKNESNRSVYITHFSVTKSFRHQGVGHLMMDRFVDTYRNVYDCIELEALKDGPAHAFYSREGFECVEDRLVKVLLRKTL